MQNHTALIFFIDEAGYLSGNAGNEVVALRMSHANGYIQVSARDVTVFYC